MKACSKYLFTQDITGSRLRSFNGSEKDVICLYSRRQSRTITLSREAWKVETWCNNIEWIRWTLVNSSFRMCTWSIIEYFHRSRKTFISFLWYQKHLQLMDGSKSLFKFCNFPLKNFTGYPSYLSQMLLSEHIDKINWQNDCALKNRIFGTRLNEFASEFSGWTVDDALYVELCMTHFTLEYVWRTFLRSFLGIVPFF